LRNVYVQTNEQENRVIAFRREDDGAVAGRVVGRPSVGGSGPRGGVM